MKEGHYQVIETGLLVWVLRDLSSTIYLANGQIVMINDPGTRNTFIASDLMMHPFRDITLISIYAMSNL